MGWSFCGRVSGAVGGGGEVVVFGENEIIRFVNVYVVVLL